MLLGDVVQQRLRVVEELARLGPLLGVVEDGGVAPRKPPGREEEVPVDVGGGVGHVEVGKDHPPRVERLDGPVRLLLERPALHLGVGEQPAGRLGAAVFGAQLLLAALHLPGVGFAVGTEQAGEDEAVAAGVERVCDHARVERRNLHGRVELRGGGPADDDRDAQSAPLELLADVRHLVERRGDESAQADAVGRPGLRLVDDARRLDHHPQVADFVAVAGHHYRDDVLADVVHVALDRGNQHAPRLGRGLLAAAFDVGGQHRHGALHDAGALDHLGQEHLARAEERAHLLHGRHEQRVDDRHGAAQRP